MILIMMGLSFLFEKKTLARPKNFLAKLKQKANISINVYCYENKLTFPIYVLRSKI